MTFKDFYQPFIDCVLTVFDWLLDIAGSEFIPALLCVFGIYTVYRLIISRVTGLQKVSGSDEVKTSKNFRFKSSSWRGD